MSSLDLDDILQLPVAERLEVLYRIWESLSSTPDGIPLSDEQRAELDRRIAAHERDPHDSVSSADVKNASAELCARLRGKT